jgi:hypothetical protein
MLTVTVRAGACSMSVDVLSAMGSDEGVPPSQARSSATISINEQNLKHACRFMRTSIPIVPAVEAGS